jgi:hypothetical protein
MRFRRPLTALVVFSLWTFPLVASAHHVSEKDLRDVFYTFDDPEPLEPHGRIRPFLNPYLHGVDPNLRCVGDAVGTWAGWVVSYGDGGVEPADYPNREEAMAFINSVEESYSLDVHSDGDPVELKTMRSGVRWSESEEGDSLLRFNQGVPVIDGALLPEGHHTLHWAGTNSQGPFENEGTPIWIADCERETNPTANADDVVVEISPIDVSGYFVEIYLDQPYEQFIGVDGFVDTVILGDVENGDELVFRIEPILCDEGDTYGDASCSPTGDVWYSDPSLNADGLKQSLHIQDGDQTWMFFNDNGYDPASDDPFEPNFIDAIFTISPATP